MICRFCGEERKLIKAHIIPRSFYRIDPTDRQPSRLVTNVEGRYTQKIRSGIYDSSLVCEECEHRFGPLDDYANELLLKSWDKFEKIADCGQCIAYRFPKFDYCLLKLFFISVLWRAHASRHVIPITPRDETLGWSASVYLVGEPALADQAGHADGVLAQGLELGEDRLLQGFERGEEPVADGVFD